MALLDRFKKSQKTDKKPRQEENVLDMVKEPAKVKPADSVQKDDTGRAHKILQNYHLSEKTNMFSSSGRYVFKVSKHANKIEVKKAIEKVYDVHVVSVNIINVLGKNRRQGRTVGSTSDWKKAIVTLKNGERISGLAEGV